MGHNRDIHILATRFFRQQCHLHPARQRIAPGARIDIGGSRIECLASGHRLDGLIIFEQISRQGRGRNLRAQWFFGRLEHTDSTVVAFEVLVRHAHHVRCGYFCGVVAEIKEQTPIACRNCLAQTDTQRFR